MRALLAVLLLASAGGAPAVVVLERHEMAPPCAGVWIDAMSGERVEDPNTHPRAISCEEIA